eukprot:2419821-Prymnesium_polylepis.1
MNECDVERMMCEERQLDELAALAAIHGDNFALEGSPADGQPACSLIVRVDDGRTATLHITLPPTYPTSSPPSLELSC